MPVAPAPTRRPRPGIPDAPRPGAAGASARLLLPLLMLLLSAPPARPQDLDTLAQQIAAEREKPYGMRVKTIASVGMLRTDDAAAVLEALYAEEKDEFIQAAALYALAACGTPQAVRRLEAILRDDTAASRCRCAALDALVRTRREESFGIVRETARSDKTDYALRVAAHEALAAYPLDRTEPLWREVVHGGPAPIRALAFKALAPLKDRGILDAARKALESSGELSEIRAAAVAPWGAAAGPTGTRLLLAHIDDADPQVRGAVAEALGSLTSTNDISLLFPELARHPDPGARALLAGALGKPDHPGVIAALEGALKDKDPDVRLAAVESLGQRKEPKAEQILQRQAQGTDEEMAIVAIGALAGHPSEATLKLLARLAESRKLPVAVAAIGALGERPPDDALPLLTKAIENPNWSIRAAAVRALGKARNRACIDLLVERLGREEGRLRGDIVDVLRALTGRQLPYDASAWKTWWTARRETFDPDAPPERPEGGDVNTVAYYGIPVLSKRVVFCLDISSSMTGFAEKEKSRMDQAKEELAQTLSALDGDVRMNIIFFDDRIQPLGRSLAPIRGRLASLLTVVKQVQPRGSTNIYDTLEYSFQDPSVDTVFLLSDGEPTDGKYVSTEEILRRIRRANRARQVVIHTISFGRSAFMQSLAEQNGGRYVERP